MDNSCRLPAGTYEDFLCVMFQEQRLNLQGYAYNSDSNSCDYFEGFGCISPNLYQTQEECDQKCIS